MSDEELRSHAADHAVDGRDARRSLTAVSLSADRVKLRSGKVIEGMFIGGDSKSVRVLLDNGQVSEVPLADAVAVEFSARKPPPTPPPAAKPAPSPAAAPAPAPAPRQARDGAGRHADQRAPDAGDRRRRSQAGQSFKASSTIRSCSAGRSSFPRGASAMLQAVQVAAVGQDEGQRQDHAQAERHRLRRHGPRSRDRPTSKPRGKARARRRRARSAAAPDSARSSAASPAAAKVRRSAR